MPVDVGDQAPDFALSDQHGRPVRLSDYRGKRPVVVVFYPLAFSRTCLTELCTLRDELADFETSEAQVLAVSVDSHHVLRAWAEQRRASRSHCSPTSGRTARRRGRTECSTTSEASRCGGRSSWTARGPCAGA